MNKFFIFQIKDIAGVMPVCDIIMKYVIHSFFKYNTLYIFRYYAHLEIKIYLPGDSFKYLIWEIKNISILYVQSMDASNRKEVKLVPIVIYFTQQEGVKVKLLAFKAVPGETAKILLTHFIILCML